MGLSVAIIACTVLRWRPSAMTPSVEGSTGSTSDQLPSLDESVEDPDAELEAIET